tara:strand:- start:458 stop:2401 length:1944 start_codon:yes stop_codon:yes gene_type:complete
MKYRVLLLSLLLLSSNVFAERLEKVQLQLKWFSSFQFAGYYMALEKGYYTQSGLDVEIIERDPNKNNIVQVLDGEAEYGVADSAVLLYRAQGKPLKILASIFQHSPLIFISKKESGIFSPYEMRGKIVSFQQGLDEAPFLAVLKQANLDKSDYQHAPLDFTGEEFIRGDVDVVSAYLSNQPYTMKEQGIDINIINPLNYGVDFYGDNLITTQQELDLHPDRAKAFLEASLKGWKYALENRDETIAVLQSKYNAKRSTDHLIYEAEIIEQMIMPELVNLGYTSIERFYRIAEIYQHVGKIDKAQTKMALDGLIYDPNQASQNYTRYLYITLALFLIMGMVIVSFLLANRRLKHLVSERTQHLSETLNFNETILNNSPLSMGVYAENGQCVLVNNAYEQLMSKSREQLLSQNFNNILSWQKTGLLEDCRIALRRHIPQYREVNCVNGEGKDIWLECRILPIHLKGTAHLLIQFIDLTVRKHLEIELRHFAFHDALTKLPNRRLLHDRLQHALLSSKRRNRYAAILFLDLNKFKQLNDMHGHEVGDQFLIEVANRLLQNVRETDTVSRVGGDEFVVLLEGLDVDITNATKQVNITADKIHSALNEEYLLGVIRHHGSTSLGIKIFKGDEADPDEILKDADEAMYKEKNSH